MIDKTIKNIKKKYFKALERILTAKIANIKNFYFFLSFLYMKGLNIKMSLISAKGYENTGVSHLTIKKN